MEFVRDTMEEPVRNQGMVRIDIEPKDLPYVGDFVRIASYVTAGARARLCEGINIAGV